MSNFSDYLRNKRRLYRRNPLVTPASVVADTPRAIDREFVEDQTTRGISENALKAIAANQWGFDEDNSDIENAHICSCPDGHCTFEPKREDEEDRLEEEECRAAGWTTNDEEDQVHHQRGEDLMTAEEKKHAITDHRYIQFARSNPTLADTIDWLSEVDRIDEDDEAEEPADADEDKAHEKAEPVATENTSSRSSKQIARPDQRRRGRRRIRDRQLYCDHCAWRKSTRSRTGSQRSQGNKIHNCKWCKLVTGRANEPRPCRPWTAEEEGMIKREEIKFARAKSEATVRGKRCSLS